MGPGLGRFVTGTTPGGAIMKSTAAWSEYHAADREARDEPARRFSGDGTGSAGLPPAGLFASAAADPVKSANDDGPVLLVGEDIAVADTQYGTVRGYLLRGIHYFLGIPYGADTSGANRFMPPQKPKAWTGVRPALWWGNSAPQNMDNRTRTSSPSFRDHWTHTPRDCLR